VKILLELEEIEYIRIVAALKAMCHIAFGRDQEYYDDIMLILKKLEAKPLKWETEAKTE
jgi:hypothetical protein